MAYATKIRAQDFLLDQEKRIPKEFVSEVFKYLNLSKKNLKTNVSKYKRKIDLEL